MEQTTRWVLGHKITSFNPTGNYDLMIGETPPKVQGPPPHLHYNYAESFLVLEGEMEFFCNGETRTVRAVEFVDLPPAVLHTFANVSDKPCKWVNMHSPKGFARFFENIGIPVEEDDAEARSKTADVFRVVLETADDYDMFIKRS